MPASPLCSVHPSEYYWEALIPVSQPLIDIGRRLEALANENESEIHMGPGCT
jgi:hypothetical protein